MNAGLLSHLSAVIRDVTRLPFEASGATPVGGGCINRAYRLRGRDGRDFFVKLNDARRHAMFAAEAAGLETIAATGAVRAPQPVASGCCGAQSFLVLEHLELGGRSRAARLGEQLAALHRCTAPPFPGRQRADAAYFGFSRDNFLGATPQPNAWADDWPTFWRERRLGFQLDLAARNGCGLQALGERLMDALPALFDGYAPQASLLHGDLWGGNHGYLADGAPVIFDPAVYYGDREADLAMTELFGGYDADFYAAYRASWPLDAGYAVRKELYNLYHVLNHANLFGGGYAKQAGRMMKKLLAEAD